MKFFAHIYKFQPASNELLEYKNDKARHNGLLIGLKYASHPDHQRFCCALNINKT